MLTLEYAHKLLCKFKKKISLCIKNREYSDALMYINAAASIEYSFYISYRDNELEDYLKEISNSIEKKSFIKKDGRKFIFLDMFSMDYCGLTQQYIDALIANRYEFLYIHERDLFGSNATILSGTLKNYSKAYLCQVPKYLSNLEKAQWLYDTICDYGADKLLMHLYPHAAFECSALYALPKEIVKYQINLTDHAFWLGHGCLDFSFEFRQFGCNVSINNRGLNPSQLLLLPYYPIMKTNDFIGFPTTVDGKIVFFSGGNYYKIVDDDHTFFRLCVGILKQCPNAVLLFAGDGDDTILRQEIEEAQLTNRFLLIGHRKDILEVFKHTDVYINTYPFGGGLMCQFAAQCSLPILNYKNNRIEEIVCQKGITHFTTFTEEDFVNEGIKLYKDVSYRKEKGQELNSCVCSISDFNEGFINSVTSNISVFSICFKEINNTIEQSEINGRLKYLNTTKAFHKGMVHLLGIKGIACVPHFYIVAIISMIKFRLFLLWKIVSK